MTTLFEALTPKAQNELVRDHVIELVTVVVRAVPDPDRPDDRLAMTIATEVKDTFAPGQPWIAAELARIREICGTAGDDFSVSMQDALLVALNRRRKDLDGLREGKIGGHPVAYLSDPQVMEFLGPILKAVKAEVSLWCLAWTVAMEREDLPAFSCLGSEDPQHDDGKLLVDCEDSFSDPDSVVAIRNVFDDSVYAEDWDYETREKIRQRIRKVNDVVGRTVREYMD